MGWLGPLVVLAACALFFGALLSALPQARAGQELDRDELLEAIEELSSARAPAAPEQRRLCALAREFAARFPHDESAPDVVLLGARAAFALGDHGAAARDLEGFAHRYKGSARVPEALLFRGLALSEERRYGEALADLETAAGASREGAIREVALYALGEAAIADGQVDRARRALGELIAEAAGPPAFADPGTEAQRARVQRRRGAEADLRDLDKIGRPAPPLDSPVLASPSAVVIVLFRRSGAPRGPLDLEVAAAVARASVSAPVTPADASFARVASCVVEVSGFEDPRLRAWGVPALPRAYVLDARRTVRAVGVCGSALAEAARRATRPEP